MLGRICSKPHTTRPPQWALCAWAIAILAGCGSSARGGANASDWAGSEITPPLPRPDFVLTDTDGKPYDFLEETRGKVAFLFFGYTYCPDVCPVHMANLSAVLRDLPREISQHVEVVFVTVDPERDTPERLADWLGHMGWPIAGLRGSREEVNAIETSLKLPASYVVHEDDGSVSVGHSASVLAFGADGPARLRYPFGIRQEDWLADIPRLVRETVPESSLEGDSRG